ncbi:MAG TPA: 16S rRNA (guanine(527)-N(7))-methyltransferase RsmG [Saprospiraceae bacterium]|nr:16S rRNA (guanine(527)-N(7))-methyltransferase RsmG [Saprospiraceae bacterium]
MDKLLIYFPELTSIQQNQFDKFARLFRDWNAQINLVSRKDIENLFVHHILHSLAIAKVIRFQEGSNILDLGTGGGFPGIPLSILMPDVQFNLIDGTGKKIMAVNDMLENLDLKNVKAFQARAEEHKSSYDFIVTRAVAEFEKLMIWTKHLYSQKQINALPNGLLALKGSSYKDELKAMSYKAYHEAEAIDQFFKEDYFKEKYVVYIQA